MHQVFAYVGKVSCLRTSPLTLCVKFFFSWSKEPANFTAKICTDPVRSCSAPSPVDRVLRWTIPFARGNACLPLLLGPGPG